MRKGLLAACMLVAVLHAGAPAVQATDEATRKNLQALLTSAGWGYDRKDLDEIKAIALPDATIRYLDGTTLSIEEWQRKADPSFDRTESRRAQYKLLEAEVEVPRANITYTVTYNYTLKGEPEHKYQSVSRWSAMLMKTPQGWRVKHYVQLSDETTRDGAPLPATVSPLRF